MDLAVHVIQFFATMISFLLSIFSIFFVFLRFFAALLSLIARYRRPVFISVLYPFVHSFPCSFIIHSQPKGRAQRHHVRGQPLPASGLQPAVWTICLRTRTRTRTRPHSHLRPAQLKLHSIQTLSAPSSPPRECDIAAAVTYCPPRSISNSNV